MSARDTIDKKTFEKLQKEIAEGGGMHAFKVGTDSMTPLIKPGDTIHVRKLEGLPKRFDILVFYAREILICHYFWHLSSHTDPGEPALLTTRQLKVFGADDLPITQSQILGVVTNFRISGWQRFKIVFKEILTVILRRGILR